MMAVSFDGGRFDVEELPEQVVKVPIERILHQHRERYVFRTSQGTVVMKHITKRMKLAIDRIRFTRYPRVAELEAEARIVYPVVMAGNKDEDAVKRANEIAAELAPTMDLYALGIIEYPFLTSPEDVEELMDSLSDEEQEAIRQMLGVLTAWGRPVDFSQLEIAERFHLQIIPIEAVEDPTYQQYRALYSVVEQEHEATRDMYSKLGVKM